MSSRAYPLRHLSSLHITVLWNACQGARGEATAGRSISFWNGLATKISGKETLTKYEWNMIMKELRKKFPDNYDMLVREYRMRIFPLKVFEKLGT